MELIAHNALRQIQRMECTQVLINDQFGQPAVLIVSPSPDHIWVSQRGEPGWERALANVFGIHDTTVTQHINTGAMSPPPGRLILPDEHLPSVPPDRENANAEHDHRPATHQSVLAR